MVLIGCLCWTFLLSLTRSRLICKVLLLLLCFAYDKLQPVMQSNVHILNGLSLSAHIGAIVDCQFFGGNMKRFLQFRLGCDTQLAICNNH